MKNTIRSSVRHSLAACLAVCIGCGFPAGKGKAEEQPNSRVVQVVRTDLPLTVVATGTVRPEVGAEVKVGPRISGVLERLYVKVGANIEQGALLAKLDDRQLRGDVLVAESGVRVAQADLDSTMQVYALEKARLARRKRLASSGLVSMEDMEVRVKAVEVARANQAAAQARLDRATELVDQVRTQLGFATIRAPISGTVTTVATKEGEAVAASFTVPTFVTIMDLDRLQVETYVDEVDIGKIKVGQKADIIVDAFANETFSGEVRAVSPEAKVRGNVVTYVVLVGLTSGNRHLLRPEMTASVTITAGERNDLLVAPVEAVQRDEEGKPYIFTLENGERVVHPVRLGEIFGNSVEIRQGIEEGARIVVTRDIGEGER